MENTTVKKYDKKRQFIKTIIFDLIFIAFCAFIAFYHFPYLIYSTGGSISLNERITSSNNYPMAGSYSMNYVTVLRGNLPSLLVALFRSDWDIVKEDKVTYDGLDYEETLAIEKLQLENSLNIAKVVAFEKADQEYEITNQKTRVISIDDDADADFKLLDELIQIDDKPYNGLEDLRSYIASFEKGHEFKFKVKDKDGKEKIRKGKSYEKDGNLIVGISVLDTFDYNTKDDLQIATKSSEAGSSGGLMLTLAIYDTILEEDISKGRRIMGTGTMDLEGNVGEIGGIKYKMLGAEKDDADIFFCPEKNYEEAKKVHEKYHLSFDLVMVKTIDEAIAYLHK